MPYEAERKALRERLGNVGVWLAVLARTPFAEARAGAATIDELGYGSLWINEGFGTKEPMSHAALLLDATDRLVLGTGIANIWARDAAATNAAAATLGEAHPGRFVLGLGVSHQPMVDSRGHNYGRPLAAMRAYLDALDEAPWAGPPQKLGGGGSARLIDDVIAWGDDDAIAARVQAHLDAGGDHVLIQPL